MFWLVLLRCGGLVACVLKSRRARFFLDFQPIFPVVRFPIFALVSRLLTLLRYVIVLCRLR